MIQLIESLQQSPEGLRELVKENLHNNNITEFISAPDFLASVNLTMDKLDEVPFFIKHVFRIIRQPSPQQILILEEYIHISQDQNIKRLAQCLLEELSRGDQANLTDFLQHLYRCIKNGDEKEAKALLQQKQEEKFAACLQLLRGLSSIVEGNNWANDQYKLKILKLIDSALASLSMYPQQTLIYLQILTNLLKKTLTASLDDFSLMSVLIQSSIKHSNMIRQIIKNMQKSTSKQIPTHFLSSVIFKYFTCLFDHEIYFKQDELIDVTILCEQIYQLIKEDFAFEELGWIAIFSVSKWISQDISEESLYKCIAFLRENDFQRSDIISEILVFNLAKVINHATFKCSPKYQMLLSTLTPKQIKYLIFKLDQTLHISTKQEILASVTDNTENFMTMALYFNITASKQAIELQKQLRNSELQKWKDVHYDIERSRYNSFEKTVITFKQFHRFMCLHQLGCLDAPLKMSMTSMLRFFKDLFVNDYFSQEYWINQQKISTILGTGEAFSEQVDQVLDFLQYEKVQNLSGAMILIQILRESVIISYTFSQKQLDFIAFYVQICLKLLSSEVFTSNITIILDFLLLASEQPLPKQIVAFILSYFARESPKQYVNMSPYSKLAYNTEAIILNALSYSNNLPKINDYTEHLSFYKLKERYIEGPRQYRDKIVRLYQRYNIQIKEKDYHFKEILACRRARKLILSQMQPQLLKSTIANISDVFEFNSPLFSGEIVVLTHLARSPQENYYFKNHFIPFIYQEYAKLYALASAKVKHEEVHLSIFNCVIDLLNQVLSGDTFSHGLQFYKSLNKSQLIYALLSNSILQSFNNTQLQQIVDICLQIVEKDNYPLLRQYISVIFCRAYLIIVKRVPEAGMRRQLIQKMRVNINVGVPIALTLGYELIESCKSSQKSGIVYAQIQSIHELLVKFISCHTAYLRAICQYYLYLYLDLVDTKDQFLSNLRQFWKQDKDSHKILTNVSMVVEGFKEGVQQQCDFLGFERVEEYPSNRVKMEYYECTAKFYSEFILNQFAVKDFISKQMFDAINVAASERYEYLKLNYLLELKNFETNEPERTAKSNLKKVIKEDKTEKPEPVKKEKQKKQQNKHKKGKNKQKIPQAQNEKLHNEHSLKDLPNFRLQSKYRMLSSKQQLSGWYRRKLDPQIIVIGTLLEKVHNFGHILRTLHRKNAMLVVPSVQPLLHPECKELVPADCDVQIVQIRHRDLHKFITLMKSLGYPLVALEQCSRSVMVEQAKFPQKFMMLLGNQRIGAPSSLLNQGDLLVQIPQIGKIRSLNVHVSMVICLWEFLIK